MDVNQELNRTNEPPEPSIPHEEFVSRIEDENKSVKMDPSLCLYLLSNGNLGVLPWLIVNGVGWFFHLSSWAAIVWLFMWNTWYALMGIIVYILAFMLKTSLTKNWFATNMVMTKALRDRDFYQRAWANDVIDPNVTR